MDNEEIQSLLRAISDHLMSMDQAWELSVAEDGSPVFSLQVPEGVTDPILKEFKEDIQEVSFGPNETIGIAENISVEGRVVTVASIHEDNLRQLSSCVEDMTVIYVPDENETSETKVHVQGTVQQVTAETDFEIDLDAAYTSAQMYMRRDDYGFGSTSQLNKTDAAKLIILPGMKVNLRDPDGIARTIIHAEDMLGGKDVYDAFEGGLEIISVPYYDVEEDKELFISDTEPSMGREATRYSKYAEMLVENLFDPIVPNRYGTFGLYKLNDTEMEKVAKDVGKVNFFSYSMGTIVGEAIQNAFNSMLRKKGYEAEEIDMLAKRVGYVSSGDIGYFGRPEENTEAKFTSVHSFSVHDKMIEAYLGGGFDRKEETGMEFAFADVLDRVTPPPARSMPSVEGKQVATIRMNEGREVLLLSTASTESVALPKRLQEGEEAERSFRDGMGNRFTFVERIDESAHNLGVTTRIGHSENHSNIFIPVAIANVIAGMLRASEQGREKNLDELMIRPAGPFVDNEEEELPQRNMLKLAKTPGFMFTETMLQTYIGEGPQQSTGWSVS